MSLTEGQKIRIEIKAIIEIRNINIIAHNARITREVYNENKRINIYHKNLQKIWSNSQINVANEASKKLKLRNIGYE